MDTLRPLRRHTGRWCFTAAVFLLGPRCASCRDISFDPDNTREVPEAKADSEVDAPDTREGSPALVKPRIHYAYDANGNVAEAAFRDAQGNLVFDKEAGFARVVNRYDSRSNLIENRSYDTEGNPVTPTGQDYSGVNFVYDENGIRTEATLRVPTSEGQLTAEIHDKVWRKLNPRGMTTEERRFNSQEVPIPQPVGYHRAVIGYNRADQPVDEAYFDVDGKPALNTIHGYSRAEYVYDRRGVRIEALCTVPDASGILNETRFGKMKREFNELSQVTNERFFDMEERPVDGYLGFHHVKNRISPDGKLLEKVHFSREGSLTESVNGYSRATYSYNTDGQCTGAEFSGLKGKPVYGFCVIAMVVPGTTAQNSGLRPGDRIASYAGKKVKCGNQLRALVTAPGDQKRELAIVRDGREIRFEVPAGLLGVRMEDVAARAYPDLLERLRGVAR